MPDLYLSIIRKAEGVFLWVRIVVRSLLTGLQNGDELSDIQHRVDELPEGLEHLYMHMFARREPKYRNRSSRILRVVAAAGEPLDVLTIWYSGEQDANPLIELTVETRHARCYQVYLRLMSQCASLLELRHSTNRNIAGNLKEVDLFQPEDNWSFLERHDFLHSSVHYAHRTAKDFLDGPDVAAIRVERSLKFDLHEWLAVHALVQLVSSAANSPCFKIVIFSWTGRD